MLIAIVHLSYADQSMSDRAVRVRSGFVESVQDLSLLFPHTAVEIQERTDAALADAQHSLAAILAVPANQRTYQNTFHLFDQLYGFSLCSILDNVAEVVSLVYADAAVRDAARESIKNLNAFWVDSIMNNKDLYDVLQAYAATTQEVLSDEQRYYMQEILATFKRGGLELPADKREIIATLKKDLADLYLAFEKNLSTDTKTALVAKEDLAGLDDDFIAALKQTDDGHYILTTDYPTSFAVLARCSVEQTRKKMWRAFENRGYPMNEAVLKTIIAKRDALACALGYASYVDFDLEDQMAKNQQTVETFLHELITRSTAKALTEFDTLIADLPESVSLTPDGKLNEWDISYVYTQYKKKHFSLDERTISEYFPVEQTIQRLFGVYEDFLGITFHQKEVPDLWHEDVRLVEVRDAATQEILGCVLLDLHPRPNKYTHACNNTIIPAMTLADGSKSYMVTSVITNFPKATSTKPALFQRSDVRTFFHELGHALHGMLGRTTIASSSGTRVKSDFVEMPSQMLEEWLWEKEVLQRVSCHYVTGQPLSDALIEKIIASKNVDTGWFVQRQAYLATISLEYFKAGADKDIAVLMQNIFKRTRPQLVYDNETHKYTSFAHIASSLYGSKYYSYMWSKVFALDLFSVIKAHHFSREIGKKYVDTILSKGGTRDPKDLLIDFLGREPQQDAFFKDLGM